MVERIQESKKMSPVLDVALKILREESDIPLIMAHYATVDFSTGAVSGCLATQAMCEYFGLDLRAIGTFVVNKMREHYYPIYRSEMNFSLGWLQLSHPEALPVSLEVEQFCLLQNALNSIRWSNFHPLSMYIGLDADNEFFTEFNPKLCATSIYSREDTELIDGLAQEVEKIKLRGF